MKLSFKKVYLDIVAGFIFTFSIVYSVSFISLESMNTARVALVFGFIYVVIFRLNLIRKLTPRIKKLFLFIIPIPFSVILFYFIGDYGVIARPLNLFLYSILGGIIVALVFNNLSNTLILIFSVILIQSLIIIYGFFNIEFKIWLSEMINIGANYDASKNLYRGFGFSSSSGAALSLIQSMAVFVVLVYSYFFKISPLLMLYYSIGLMSILISVILVGRTGLLMSVVLLLLLFLMNKGYSKKEFFPLLFFALFIVAFAFNYLVSIVPEGFSVDYFMHWAFGFFMGQDKTLHAISSMPLPEMSVQLFHGYGLVSLINDSNPSGNDSGFIQFLYAYGIPVFVVFYAVYFYLLFYLLGFLPLFYRSVLVLAFFGLEFKEPFLFKYSTLFILVLVFISIKLWGFASEKNIIAHK